MPDTGWLMENGRWEGQRAKRIAKNHNSKIKIHNAMEDVIMR